MALRLLRRLSCREPPARLRIGPDAVRNLYAYDASGQPLTGVQPYDQRGRPVAVDPVSSQGQGSERRVTCPWVNGTTPLFNVLPLPERLQRRGSCLARAASGARPAAQQTPPLAAVPPVSSTAPLP